ncbi:Eukaryotic translation initiation factor 3 subunit I [Gurleya vavrai]
MTQTSTQYRITIHDRPITDLQFNRDGDLLFSACKDATVSLYRLKDRIIGTYISHKGAINSISVSQDSTKLATGASDKMFIIWDIEGSPIKEIECESMVKSVQFLNDSLLYCTDDLFNKTPMVGIFDLRSGKTEFENELKRCPTKAIINFSGESIVVGDCEGGLTKIDIRNNSEERKNFHSTRINSLKNSACSSFFVTGSSDAQVKIIDYNLNEFRSFVTEDPVNSAVIMRDNVKIVSSGGLNARDVTLTRSKSSFSVDFFDIGKGEFIGGYNTHFGTVNCIDVHPNCEIYCSAGEEGFINIVEMGQDFFDAPFTEY